VLAIVPAAVFCIALLLPKDRAVVIPLGQSIRNFWVGLNTGPLLWIVLFFFLFHFQPQGGAIWNAYVVDTLGFSQTQAGYGDGAAYAGYLAGTIAFARWGVRLQDRFGMKRLFSFFIPLSAVWVLTQLLLVDPTFTRLTTAFAGVVPIPMERVRIAALCLNQFFLYTVQGFVRMSTFSLVGVVIPAAAAGSLFAGFMSVANLGYSFSYSTGSWLYAHGMEYPFVASLQMAIFGVPANEQGEMSIAMLTLIGSASYFLSFLVIQKLPDQKETRSSEDVQMAGAEGLARLDSSLLRGVNVATVVAMIAVAAWLSLGLGQDPIASVILSFFACALLRKVYLDWRMAALA
jgi:MFS family permease